MKFDIQIGDKLIELGSGYISYSSSHYFKMNEYDDEYIKMNYKNLNYKDEVYIESSDLIDVDLVVDKICFKEGLIIIKIIANKGIYKGIDLYGRCSIKYAFTNYMDSPILKIDYKYRRLKNLKYLGI